MLLTLHRKAERWLQLGGHLEVTDPTVADAALREAVEEGGVSAVSLLVDSPVDVERQQLRGAFGGCAVHWDVGYLAVAHRAGRPVVSSESHDVRWWPLSDVHRADPDVATRLQAILAGLPR